MVKPQPAFELIETMHADAVGHIAFWAAHMARLSRSAQALGYPSVCVAQLQKQVQDALEQAPLETSPIPGEGWRVRLLLNRTGQATVTVHALAALAKPQFVALSEERLTSQELLLQHKTTYRPWYEGAMHWLQAHPAFFDVLFVNERDELCEGTRSNVYVFIDGAWVTPVRDSGLLSGVWREHLLQTHKVHERVIHRAELTPDLKVRLSNGLRGWFDVVPDLSTSVT